MNPYKICTEKAYFFLVNHTTLKLDKPLRFKSNLLQILYKLIMLSDYKIRDKKAQCNINKKLPIIWALTSDKFNEYEYLTKEGILFTRESDRRS